VIRKTQLSIAPGTHEHRPGEVARLAAPAKDSRPAETLPPAESGPTDSDDVTRASLLTAAKRHARALLDTLFSVLTLRVEAPVAITKCNTCEGVCSLVVPDVPTVPPCPGRPWVGFCTIDMELVQLTRDKGCPASPRHLVCNKVEKPYLSLVGVQQDWSATAPTNRKRGSPTTVR
jgi:hypothetical protein